MYPRPNEKMKKYASQGPGAQRVNALRGNAIPASLPGNTLMPSEPKYFRANLEHHQLESSNKGVILRLTHELGVCHSESSSSQATRVLNRAASQ